MTFEELLNRDLKYPEFMDWPMTVDLLGNVTYYSQNPNYKVLYKSVDIVNCTEHFYKLINIQNTRHYFGRNIHRIKGPAQITYRYTYEIKDKAMSHKVKTENYEIEWRNRNTLHRKDGGPAVYNFQLTKNKIENLDMEWHCKTDYMYQGTLHRLNGPAIHRYAGIYIMNNEWINDYEYTRRANIKYFIRGKRYSEYDYWIYMLKHFPNKMPKIISNTVKKITFDTDLNKPAPKAIFKKINKLQWSYNYEMISSSRYWELMDFQLMKSNNWLRVY